MMEGLRSLHRDRRRPGTKPEHKAKRVPVDLDRLGDPARESLGQSVSHGGLDCVTLDGPEATG